ncbi:hypothetical protein [Psychroflexus tropicus]|uniref:hypothetical protein n=1 Tax=Psychroflexus tropicus TaxID=197345 RepID=UPI00037D5076|nr:hypothetical protein [Psychroflexus tropicus]
MKTLSIKAILFIVMFLSVLSCQNEDTHEHLISELEPKKQKLSNVSSKDIPEVMNFLRQGGKTQLDFAIHSSGSNVNKSGSEDLILTTVELDNIKN